MPESTNLVSNEVDVAVTGAVAYAETTEAAPTDADTALGAGWSDVGYLSADGVVEARERSTNNIVAWQNSDVIRVVTTEASITVQFTMVQTNVETLELFYGAELDTVSGSIDIVPRQSGGRRSVVVDYVDGDKFVRLYLPEAEVTAVEGPTLQAGGEVGYGVTLTGYPAELDAGPPAVVASARKFFSELVAA
jgi:hypothetical protein